jgi:hypothetical protein
MSSFLTCWVIISFSFLFYRACDHQPSRAQVTREASNSGQSKGGIAITQSGATKIAEEFVARNGYTESPPSVDEPEIRYEVTDPPQRAVALAQRANTLEPKAYGVMQRKQDQGWIVFFRFNATNHRLVGLIPDFEEYSKQYGRAVVMDLDGANVHIEHQAVKIGPQ